MDWTQYHAEGLYDELIDAQGAPRPVARGLIDKIANLSDAELAERRAASDLAIKVMGISFTVYSDGENVDRSWPFDILPRIIPADEWARAEAGLKQRVKALNMFIEDIYHDQNIIKDGVFPAEVLADSPNYRPQCEGISPPGGIWAHICGSDLVRDGDGTLYVLEDNLRVPSGVSYMVENRLVTKRVFPELFEHSNILPVDEYPAELYETLAELSPRAGDDPVIVLMTPGIFNSAYFEHAWLAQQMGIQLVEGPDMIVGDDDCVYLRTIEGLKRVDVIYRRVDDAFIDPEVFREDSMLGVRGLMRAWRKGNVGLANAPGCGMADDKVVYAFVPDIIKYYLDEEPLIPNVPSYRCMYEKEREYTLANLDKLVVKPANESGGYGMLIGPRADQAERDKFAKLIQDDPRNYIAQPTLNLSVSPTLCDAEDGKAFSIEPRHLDLRPFILSRSKPYVTTGGLTRVAMVKGSLVVNSSQGGGSKDTWILEGEA